MSSFNNFKAYTRSKTPLRKHIRRSSVYLGTKLRDSSAHLHFLKGNLYSSINNLQVAVQFEFNQTRYGTGTCPKSKGILNGYRSISNRLSLSFQNTKKVRNPKLWNPGLFSRKLTRGSSATATWSVQFSLLKVPSNRCNAGMRDKSTSMTIWSMYRMTYEGVIQCYFLPFDESWGFHVSRNSETQKEINRRNLDIKWTSALWHQKRIRMGA